MGAKALPPPRLLAVLGPVYAAGLAAIAAASVSFPADPRSTGQIAGLLGLLGASIVAERFPVPVPSADAGGVSLSFVFGVATIVLYGWAAGVLVVFAAPVVMQLIERRPPTRVAYNASAFAISALAAGVASGLIAAGGIGALAARVGVAASAEYLVNLLLISIVVARSSRQPTLPSIASNVRWTIAPFAFMGSATLALVSLWGLSPLLSCSLAGPLLAIALYQRSTHRALQATRLASTDPLTGVGNHRHFHECLARALAEARSSHMPLSLCVIDVDDFKRINDRLGHPAGDEVLAKLAAVLRRDGEAFRLGGDEFALILPGQRQDESLEAATAISARIAALSFEGIGAVTISAGVATFPDQATDREELIRFADSALYWAKEQGKNCAYAPELVELARLSRLPTGYNRASRYRAAALLASAVDARDAYTGGHSDRVAELAARIGARMGLNRDDVELLRLAGRLHDLGKLAVPEDILRKSDALTQGERHMIQRHPEAGFRMLKGLGIAPVDSWVLHHHERWDGTGYPDGLAGSKILLGARIIFVADAYDAMTSARSYTDGLAAEIAVEELQRQAGTQFDPDVVTALTAELGQAPRGRAAAAA